MNNVNLHPSTCLHVLDINDESSAMMNLSDIFNRYARYMTKVDHDIALIDFTKYPECNVKVQDWNGWTEFRSIKQIKTSPDRFTLYTYNTHDSIPNTRPLTFVGDNPLTAYIPKSVHIAFHGEVKYAVKIIPANAKCKLMVRMYNIPEDIKNNEEIVSNFQFVVFEYNENLSNEIEYHWDGTYYQLEVKSGFANLNNIHMRVCE